MRSNNILSALIMSVLLLSVCYGQKAEDKTTGSMRKNPAATQMTHEIYNIENQITDAIKAKDMNQFGKYLSDDFRGVYSDRIYTKEDEISRVRNSELKSMNKSDENVVFPADNVAILTYKANSTYSVKGKDMSGTYNISSVLVKENGQWKVVEHTMIKEMK